MGVKYKYRDESEIIISDANDWEITRLEDIEITYYQPVGLMSNPVTGEEFFYTTKYQSLTAEIIDNPNFEYITHSDGSTFWAITAEEKYLLKQTFGQIKREIILNETSLYPDKLILAVARSFDTKQPFPVDGTPSSQIDFATHPFNFYSWLLVWYQNFPLGNKENYTFQPPFLWNPIPDLVAQYKLDILLDGTIIYSRTERFQPEYVELTERQCSNNTCPVLCGETVCCYGSNGIATDSFLLSESAYQ